MRRYELIPTRTKHPARAVQYDEAKKIVYVYVRQPTHVEVFKFTKAQMDRARNGTELLAANAPKYRVSGGQCNCPGFDFRGKCRHTEHVRYLLTESGREGWTGGS